jgi:hypothetical protein
MKLMNSAIMPVEGSYTCRKISRECFCETLKQNYIRNNLINHIGYPQNLAMIHKWTGILLFPSRDVCRLESADSMLVMRVSYRITDRSGKRLSQPSEDDFEFFLVEYAS